MLMLDRILRKVLYFYDLLFDHNYEGNLCLLKSILKLLEMVVEWCVNCP